MVPLMVSNMWRRYTHACIKSISMSYFLKAEKNKIKCIVKKKPYLLPSKQQYLLSILSLTESESHHHRTLANRNCFLFICTMYIYDVEEEKEEKLKYFHVFLLQFFCLFVMFT